MRRLLPVVTMLTMGCGSAVAPAAVTAEHATPEASTVAAAPIEPEEHAAPASAPASGPGLSASGLSVAEGDLALEIAPEVAELLRREQGFEIVLVSMTRAGSTEGAHVLFVLFSYSAIDEYWARARADGQYDQLRRDFEQRIATCRAEDAASPCNDCEGDEVQRLTRSADVVAVARFSVTGGGRPALDGVEPILRRAGFQQARVVRFEDLDGDGRPELEVRVDVESGGCSEGEGMYRGTRAVFLDSDSLHRQATVEVQAAEAAGYGQEMVRGIISFPEVEGESGLSVRVIRWLILCHDSEDTLPSEGRRFEDPEEYRRATWSARERGDESGCGYLDSVERHPYDVEHDQWMTVED